MGNKKNAQANDAVRQLWSIGRLRGVVFLHEDRLFLLSKPATSPPNPQLLASSLETLPDLAPQKLATLLGCAEALELSTGKLGRWSYQLKRLEQQHTLSDWIQEGIHGLKNWRGVDVDARIELARTQLSSIAELFEQRDTFSRVSQDEPPQDPEHIWQALRLSHDIIANFPHDLLSLFLKARPISLLKQATQHTHEAHLASALLGWLLRNADDTTQHNIRCTLPPQNAATFDRALVTPHIDALKLLCFDSQLFDLYHKLPAKELSKLLPSTQRVTLFYGRDAGAEFMRHGATPHLNKQKQRERFFASMRPWLEQIELVEELEKTAKSERGELEDWELWPDVQNILETPSERRHVPLTRSFLRHVTQQQDERVLGLKPLTRIAHIALKESLTRASWVLCTKWFEASEEHEPPQGANHLGITLVHPGSPRALTPRDWPRRFLNDLIWTLAEIPAQKAIAQWDILTNHASALKETPAYTLTTLLKHQPAPALLDKIIERDLADACDDMDFDWKAIEHYVSAYEILHEYGVSKETLHQSWLFSLFRDRASWPELLVLVLARAARTQKESPQTLAMRLMALSHVLRSASHTVVEHLEAWESVRVEQEPENFSVLCEALDIEPEQAHAYLHHRRRCGHDETFSRTVCEPLSMESKREAEIKWLTQTLQEDDNALAAGRASRMRARLTSLQDEPLWHTRILDARRRAKNCFLRDFELLQTQSFEIALQHILRHLLSNLLQDKIPDTLLSPNLFAALGLFEDRRVDRELLRSLLRDALHERPLAKRPQNASWLDRAREQGIHTRRWLDGFDQTISLGELTFRLVIEQDPLHVLQMGTYFDTCLSLEDGFNRYSALINALDANKHVLYAYDEQGHVVGRKLIAVSRNFELLGYRCYAMIKRKEPLQRAIDIALLDFAKACNLSLTNQGKPETLHGNQWYDDGLTHWSISHHRDMPGDEHDQPLAKDWPQDVFAHVERRFFQALEANTPQHWITLLGCGVRHYELAAHSYLMRFFPEQAPAALRGWNEESRIQGILSSQNPARVPVWLEKQTGFQEWESAPLIHGAMMLWNCFLSSEQQLALQRRLAAEYRRNVTCHDFYHFAIMESQDELELRDLLDAFELHLEILEEHECSGSLGCASCSGRYEPMAELLSLQLDRLEKRKQLPLERMLESATRESWRYVLTLVVQEHPHRRWQELVSHWLTPSPDAPQKVHPKLRRAVLRALSKQSRPELRSKLEAQHKITPWEPELCRALLHDASEQEEASILQPWRSMNIEDWTSEQLQFLGEHAPKLLYQKLRRAGMRALEQHKPTGNVSTFERNDALLKLLKKLTQARCMPPWGDPQKLGQEFLDQMQEYDIFDTLMECEHDHWKRERALPDPKRWNSLESARAYLEQHPTPEEEKLTSFRAIGLLLRLLASKTETSATRESCWRWLAKAPEDRLSGFVIRIDRVFDEVAQRVLTEQEIAHFAMSCMYSRILFKTGRNVELFLRWAQRLALPLRDNLYEPLVQKSFLSDTDALDAITWHIVYGLKENEGKRREVLELMCEAIGEASDIPGGLMVAEAILLESGVEEASDIVRRVLEAMPWRMAQADEACTFLAKGSHCSVTLAILALDVLWEKCRPSEIEIWANHFEAAQQDGPRGVWLSLRWQSFMTELEQNQQT